MFQDTGRYLCFRIQAGICVSGLELNRTVALQDNSTFDGLFGAFRVFFTANIDNNY